MQVVGPKLDARASCEQVLRSLPQWFGIEDALVMYADDTLRLPTFAVFEEEEMVGFVTLMEHGSRTHGKFIAWPCVYYQGTHVMAKLWSLMSKSG